MMRFLLVPLALLAVATSARSETAAAPSSGAPVMSKSGAGQATSRRVVSEKAKVTAVDVEKRTLTVEGKSGKPETFVVSSKVKRLNEIAPGDTIVIKYEQGLLLQFAPEGDKAAEPSGSVQMERAGAEKAPSGSVTAQVRGTVTVTAVDQKARTVVIETPRGELVKLKADPSIDIAKVKPGQKYNGVYSEQVAISVEKAKPAAKK